MKKQKGFTLIELLVVIAIIGLLSTLAVVSLNNARAKARDARRISDVKQVQTALEMYFGTNNKYPPKSTAYTIGTEAILSDLGFGSTALGSTYMAKVPTDPTPTESNCTVGYTYKGTDSSYYIQYCLGSKSGDANAGANTACSSGIVGCTVF